MTFTAMLSAALPIGLGATLVMDVWGLLLRRLGVAAPNFAMVGRWAGICGKGVCATGRLPRRSLCGTN